MKRFVLQVVAFLTYWIGIDALFYWLNRRAKRIITFHNVLPDEVFDVRCNGVSTRESDFRKIVEEVGRLFVYSVDVWDVKSITITFDDGYLNQYEIAGRILAEKGIPAIIFLSGYILNAMPENALVVDLVLHWCEYAPSEAIKKAYPNADLPSRDNCWVRLVWSEFCKDVEGRGRNLLKRLDDIYSISKVLDQLSVKYKRLRLGGINKQQLDELSSRGWKIGWHAKTHFPLSKLSDEAIHEELDSPPECRNVVLSFPYGELISVDERVLKIAKEMGYPCAVSNMPTANHLTGRFFIPRIALPADKYRLHFRLSGFEYFLKTCKLLSVVNYE